MIHPEVIVGDDEEAEEAVFVAYMPHSGGDEDVKDLEAMGLWVQDVDVGGQRYIVMGLPRSGRRSIAQKARYRLPLDEARVAGRLTGDDGELTKRTLFGRYRRVLDDDDESIYVQYGGRIGALLRGKRHSRALDAPTTKIMLLRILLDDDRRYEAVRPLHDAIRRRKLVIMMSLPRCMPSLLPLDEVVAYFGDHLGVYLAFVGHQTTWLTPFALVGAAYLGCWYFLHSFAYFVVATVFAAFAAGWGVLVVQSWKRRQAVLTFEFGGGATQTGREGNEKPKEDDGPRLAFIVFVVACCCCAGVVLMVHDVLDDSLGGVLVTAAINVVLVEAVAAMYRLALRAHYSRRDAVFHVVNYNATLVGVAFFLPLPSTTHRLRMLAVMNTVLFWTKPLATLARDAVHVTRPAEPHSCGIELQQQKRPHDQYDDDKSHDVDLDDCEDMKEEEIPRRCGEVTRQLEEDLLLAPAEASPLDNETVLVTRYAFSMLFVVAMPLMPLFALVTTRLETHLDVRRLLDRRRRWPRSASTMGSLFQGVAAAAVLTNAGLVFFVIADGLSKTHRIWGFLIFQNTVFGFMMLLHLAINNIPPDIALQLHRQDLVTRNIIDIDYDLPDDDDDDGARPQVVSDEKSDDSVASGSSFGSTDVDTEPDQETQDEQKIVEFYREHNPAKLWDVAPMLREYRAEGMTAGDLYDAIRTKYHVTAEARRLQQSQTPSDERRRRPILARWLSWSSTRSFSSSR